MNVIPLHMPAVSFIHPSLAWWAVGVGVLPILVHLLHRRRHRRIKWAAMEFLLAASRRSARRVRIEQWVLLALRTAIVVLLALALARPFTAAAPLADVTRTHGHRIIVLDNSYSMGTLIDGGQTLFDRAKDVARNLIASFAASDAVSLVTLAKPAAAPIAQPAYDRRLTEAQLSEMTLSQQATDLAGGLTLAEEILEESKAPQGNRTVYLISDNAAKSWTPATSAAAPAVEAARTVAKDAQLYVIQVGPVQRDNLAVTAFEATSSLAGVGLPVELLIEVTNYSRRTADDVRVQIRRDGRIVRTLPFGAIEPSGAVRRTLMMEFDAPGDHRLEALLIGIEDDVLALDNAGRMALEVHEHVNLLLIDGKPGLTPISGQAGYLQTALAPKIAPADTTFVVPRTVTESELPAEVLEDFAMIALCNVRRLGEETWGRLAAYVRQGGGLLVFLGDQVDADDYNRYGFADGGGVLPAALGRPAYAIGEREQFVRFKPEPFTHPALRDFREADRSAIFLARIHQYVHLNRIDEASGVPILYYDNDAPAMVEKTLSRGRTCLINTTANMDWNNLPAKGDYVSLMMNLLQYLSPGRYAARNLLVGEPLQEPLTSAQCSMAHSVLLPAAMGNVSPTPSLRSTADGMELLLHDTNFAGFYELGIGSSSVLFAVNPDHGESDLTSLTGSRLMSLLDTHDDGAVQYVSDVESLRAHRAGAAYSELYMPLLIAVLFFLLIESFLAMKFGRRR